MALPQRRPPRRVVEEPYKVNERILAREVRVVGENVEQGIYETNKAQAMAKAQNLDLVEVSPNAVPPVCRIVDYSKFKYEQKKKQKEIKANATKVVIKEIRFGPNTDDHDFEFKLKHAINFLKEGAKVKAYVQFVGRAIVFKDRGFQLLERFSKGLEDYGKIESEPKLEGKRMSMFLSPKVVAPKNNMINRGVSPLVNKLEAKYPIQTVLTVCIGYLASSLLMGHVNYTR